MTYARFVQSLFSSLMPAHMDTWSKKSILFAQIFYPYEATLGEFAQINDDLFAHVYKA